MLSFGVWWFVLFVFCILIDERSVGTHCLMAHHLDELSVSQIPCNFSYSNAKGCEVVDVLV